MSLEFIGTILQLSKFFTMSQDLSIRPFRFHLVLSPITIKSLIVKLKDLTPKDEKSDVYTLDCDDCPGIYI